MVLHGARPPGFFHSCKLSIPAFYNFGVQISFKSQLINRIKSLSTYSVCMSCSSYVYFVGDNNR